MEGFPSLPRFSFTTRIYGVLLTELTKLSNLSEALSNLYKLLLSLLRALPLFILTQDIILVS